MSEERKVPMTRPEAEERSEAPNVDIYETEEGLTLLVDLPGAKEADVEVHVEEDVLSIAARAGQAPPAGAAVLVREFEPRLFKRTFALSRDLDRDAIKGKVANGVLRLNLPQAAQAKVRRIAVKAVEPAAPETKEAGKGV